MTLLREFGHSHGRGLSCLAWMAGTALALLQAVPSSAETLFAVDLDHVRAYDTTSRPSTTDLAIGDVELGNARSVAVDSAGKIYVYDQGPSLDKSYIRQFAADGSYIGLWNADAGLTSAEKMVFGPDGDLYVVDSSATTPGVYRFNGTTGEAKGLFTKGAKLGFPFGLAFDDSGQVYVSDPAVNASRILRYGPDGSYQETVLQHRSLAADDLINFPRGLCWGNDDWLYIVDHFDEVVYRYDVHNPTKTIEKFAEVPGSSPQDCVYSTKNGSVYIDAFGPNGVIPIDKVLPDYTASVGDRFAKDLPGHRVLALSDANLGGTTTTTSTTTTTEPTGICGDATDDGKITSTDALRVLRAAVGGSKCPLYLCDTDNSGGVTASDALRVLKKAVGQVITLICG